jgi:hypothetical protein
MKKYGGSCQGMHKEPGGEEILLYSRQISVQYHVKDQLVDCPMKWLDSFSMRSFTNDSIFDDTLPVADGSMRIGTRVPLVKLKEAMEDWFKRKGYLGKEQELVVEEIQNLTTGKH